MEGELRGVSGCERFKEFEVDPDQIARPALSDRHPSFAHLVIARPRIDCAVSGGRPSYVCFIVEEKQRREKAELKRRAKSSAGREQPRGKPKKERAADLLSEISSVPTFSV
jgi:hypothetical protein